MIRIFVVGSPRSGTTLVQRVLAAHPALTTFPESHFLPALLGASRLRRHLGLARRDAARTRLREFLAEAGLADDDAERRLVSATSRGSRPWMALFGHLLDTGASRRGASGWVEKTPIHLHYLSPLARGFPDAPVVHVLRRGEDAVASVVEVTRRHPEAWGGARSIEAAARRWRLDMELHRRWVDRPGHVAVLHDELLLDPPGVARRLAASVGLDFDPAMLDAPGGAGHLRTRGEVWKDGVDEAISPGAATPAEQRLSADELARLRELVAGHDPAALVRG